MTTKRAPPEVKKPPLPPPPREDREPIPVRSRTAVQREVPGSARDRRGAFPDPGYAYASSRASSMSAGRRDDSPPTSELLEAMKAMQKQLDDLKKERRA